MSQSLTELSKTSLQPVVWQLVEDVEKTTGRELTRKLSRLARECLQVSARYSQLNLPHPPPQDPDGVPLSVEGNFWSITHKPAIVAACAAAFPIGIDVEIIKVRTPELLNYVVSEEEWQIAGDSENPWPQFYRFFTGKEAVLKAHSIGIAGLSRCRLTKVITPREWQFSYVDETGKKHTWLIEYEIRGNLIAALTRPRGMNVKWHWQERNCD